MNNTSKKRVLKREPIANLSGNQLDWVKGGTGTGTCTSSDTCSGECPTFPCATNPSVASCACNGPTTSVITCHNTGWYCCV